MDSASHFVVGFGLAGLSQVDPVVQSNPALFTAVLIGCVAGSQAPDFDTVTRFINNETYIRQHRGASHSLPAILGWSLLISLILYGFVTVPSYFSHIFGWTLLAVCLHVFMDLFNTYGTQALRPFQQTWISWNIIHIFDTFIFGSHLVAILLWLLDVSSPTIIFPLLYAVIAIYYIVRMIYHRYIDVTISKQLSLPDDDTLMVFPTVHFSHWHVMRICQANVYELGTYRAGEVRWYEIIQSDEHPLIEVSKQHSSVQALLHFASYTVAQVIEHQWGTEVRWSDVRYRYRKQFPFVAIVFYNHKQEPIASYVGWLNDKKLYKKLYKQANLIQPTT